MDTTARTRGGRWLVAVALTALAGCGTEVVNDGDPNTRGRIDGGGGAGGSMIGSAGGSTGAGGALVSGTGGAISGTGGMVPFCGRRPYPCDTQTQICTENNNGTGACLTQCSPCGTGMRCVGSGSCSTCAGTNVCSVTGAGGGPGSGGSSGTGGASGGPSGSGGAVGGQDGFACTSASQCSGGYCYSGFTGLAATAKTCSSSPPIPLTTCVGAPCSDQRCMTALQESGLAVRCVTGALQLTCASSYDCRNTGLLLCSPGNTYCSAAPFPACVITADFGVTDCRHGRDGLPCGICLKTITSSPASFYDSCITSGWLCVADCSECP